MVNGRALGRLCAVLFGVAAGLVGLGDTALASPISVSDSSVITADGQLHSFTFSPLPASDGTGGQFTITLRGDYSPRSYPPLSEGSAVTFDGVAGDLQLYNDNGGGNGVGSNTVAGLALDSWSKSGGGNDFTLDWTFDVSGPLMTALLAGAGIGLDVQNASDVAGSYGGFVAVGFGYESGQPVPEPSTLALLGMAAVGFVGNRRRKRRRAA